MRRLGGSGGGASRGSTFNIEQPGEDLGKAVGNATRWQMGEN